MTELQLINGEPNGLKPVQSRNYRGTKIPGAVLYQFVKDNCRLELHVFHQPSFRLSLLQVVSSESVLIRGYEEYAGLQMETVLGGEVSFDFNKESIMLRAGQYLLNRQRDYQVYVPEHKNCRCLQIHYTGTLLETLGFVLPVSQEAERPLPPVMLETIHSMLDHPFAEALRPFYYGNCIRELLFSHVSGLDFTRPGELSPRQMAIVYETDQYIAENLDAPHTIGELARRAGTNSFFLKKAYEQVFGMGIFPRLIQRRMQHAQFLLENTDRPLKDIGSLSGYETLAGFITEFRKRFGMTPNQWRKVRRGMSN